MPKLSKSVPKYRLKIDRGVRRAIVTLGGKDIIWVAATPKPAAKNTIACSPSGPIRRDTTEKMVDRRGPVWTLQYGLSSYGLAVNLGKPTVFARNLLQLHRETYSEFWRWSQRAVDTAMFRGRIETVFGWRIHTSGDSNPRSLANFPCQANGAEMLRLACCLTTENGISVCCPVHDALLIEGSIDEIDEKVAQTKTYMAEASRIVLGGFELNTDVEIVRYPDRYMDPRGEQMWEKVMRLCGELK